MNSILSVVARILVTVISVASPELVKGLKAYLVEFRKKAAATPNPWDDVLAEALCQILGVTS